MDREDGQDVNPFSGRRAKLEAIAMDLKAETTPEKLARNKFKNKFFKEKAKEVRALFSTKWTNNSPNYRPGNFCPLVQFHSPLMSLLGLKKKGLCQ